MDSKEIWDGSALTESDKTIAKVKYEGSKIDANTFICATSNSALSLFKAITEKLPPAGHFIVELYDIVDPYQYANGHDSEFKLTKKYNNSVFVMNNVCLISFEHLFGCSHEIIKVFYETFKPKDIIILNSIHRSLFHGKTEVPFLYIFSENGEQPKLPLPNIISGLAAGLFNYSAIVKANCRIWEMVEEDFGPSGSSFNLWATKLKDLISIDIDAITARAVTLNDIKENEMGLVYS